MGLIVGRIWVVNEKISATEGFSKTFVTRGSSCFAKLLGGSALRAAKSTLK